MASNNFSCYSSVYHLIHYPKRLCAHILFPNSHPNISNMECSAE